MTEATEQQASDRLQDTGIAWTPNDALILFWIAALDTSSVSSHSSFPLPHSPRMTIQTTLVFYCQHFCLMAKGNCFQKVFLISDAFRKLPCPRLERSSDVCKWSKPENWLFFSPLLASKVKSFTWRSSTSVWLPIWQQSFTFIMAGQAKHILHIKILNYFQETLQSVLSLMVIKVGFKQDNSVYWLQGIKEVKSCC